LRQEVPKDFFSEKFSFSVKDFFPFAKLETSTHFLNQRKIQTLKRGGATFFEG
jgi:hypothetical protein